MFDKRNKGTLAVGAVLTAGSLVLGLTGCGGSSSGSVKVGLITKTDSNPYFVKLREAAKAQADKDGAQLIALAGAFDGDNEGQVAAIENMVGQGVKGILITPELLHRGARRDQEGARRRCGGHRTRHRHRSRGRRRRHLRHRQQGRGRQPGQVGQGRAR